MKKILRMGVGLFLISLLCGGVSLSASEIPALQEAKDSAEKARVHGLIEKARKEGKLIWTGIMIEPHHAKYILEGFKKYYGLKDLKAEYSYAQSGQIVARVEQLVKAGRPTPDIVWSSSWDWFRDLMNRGLLTRYESPYYKDYTISHRAGNSRPGYWVADSYSFHPMYNVAALAKAGIKDFNPAGWWDFTDPRLGKYTSMTNIPKSTSSTSIALGLNKVLGEEWFRKMAKLKPAVHSKTAQGRDWCASGEYPISLTSHAKNAAAAKKTGADIRLVYPKEGIVLLPFAPVIPKAGEHRAAARLFIDYVRSAPGTDQVAASGSGLLFGRPGVKMPPNEFLPPAETIKVIPMDWDKDETEETIKKFHEFIIRIGLSY